MIKTAYLYGMSLEDLRAQIRRLCEERFTPEEVWITSIMTYWWESTRDVVQVALEELPQARIFIGGVYPSLAPDHAEQRIAALAPDRMTIVQGEIYAASDMPTDLSLYDASTASTDAFPTLLSSRAAAAARSTAPIAPNSSSTPNMRRVRRRSAAGHRRRDRGQVPPLRRARIRLLRRQPTGGQR